MEDTEIEDEKDETVLAAVVGEGVLFDAITSESVCMCGPRLRQPSSSRKCIEHTYTSSMPSR